MDFRIVFMLVFILASSVSAGPLEGRIVSGADAIPGEYPYAVSYRYFDKHNCGGSIIGENWILTAAHCIHEEFNNEGSILFGSVHIQNGLHPTQNIRGLKKTIRHPLYEPFDGYPNDIGLLELDFAISFNNFAQAISLPNFNEPTPTGIKGTLVGWGYPKDNTTATELLQKVDIYVYPDEACKRIHGKNLTTEVHICAGVPEGGKGQCTGDSGGPLAVNRAQVGIVSWSVKPCALKGYPGVFTRVSHYRYWINEVTGI